MQVRDTWLRHNKLMYPAQIGITDEHIFFLSSPFGLKDELAVMQGARWMGYDKVAPMKAWRVTNNRRNRFNLAYLEGQNVFKRYTTPLSEFKVPLPATRYNFFDKKEWPYFEHQLEMARHILFRKQCEVAGEMGTGKSLAAFLAAEIMRVPEVWYVAPKSALASVQLDAQKWGYRARTRYMTYDELKKILANWKAGEKPPQAIIFDEASRVKTPTSQRSQAAMYIAEAIRDAYGDDGYIVLMSGSPAPKSPLDWYWQCEIACPGYIKEGDIHKFQRRLALMELQQDVAATKFYKLLAWRDGNPNKCDICGQEAVAHQCLIDNPHAFVPMRNEIETLYRRMAGLVLVKLKKDCLKDLPDKIYRVVRLKPSMDLLRAARLVQAASPNAITAMTLLRELSDGFQYRDIRAASELCEYCHGQTFVFNNAGEQTPCALCNATGSKQKVTREIVEVPSPKMDVVTDLLDENDDKGRLVFYAGFTASIDRICAHVQKQGWDFIRVDGRGWYNSFNPALDNVGMLKAFQDISEERKIAFIGHPGSAGMGLTLTASSMIVYVSNDFNAESRIQSEDRIHRPGMDTNKGATIVDLVLLPTDQKVLDNLKRKRELQSITLGEIQHAMDTYDYTTSPN